MSGLRPVTYTITTFMISRAFEAIKLDVCYHKAPVVIVGVGAGLSYASLGPTHHSFEDIAIMRVLPGLTVVCPADPLEVRASLRAALQHHGPVYLRLGKKGEPAVHTEMPAFEIGKAMKLRAGDDVTLLSTGTLMPNVLAAADALSAKGVSVEVVHMHTVKPLDHECLLELFSSRRHVVVVEEHSRIGGFSSAIAEWVADQGPVKARLLRLALADRFIHEAGGQKYARKQAGLDPDGIAESVLKTIG
jgi:transketolase